MTFGIGSPRSKNKKLTSAIGTNGALSRKKGIKKTTACNNDKRGPSAASAGSSESLQTRITTATPRTTANSKVGKSKLKSIPIKRSKGNTSSVYTRRTSPVIHEESEEQHLQEPIIEDRDDTSTRDAESCHSVGSREHASLSEERKSVVQVLEEEFQSASNSSEDKKDTERDPSSPDQAATLNVGEERNENEVEDPTLELEASEQPDDDETVPAKGQQEEEKKEEEVEHANDNDYTNESGTDKYASKEEIGTIDEATTGASLNAREKQRSPSHPSESNLKHRMSNERDSERERVAERRNNKFESKSNERPPRERSRKSRYQDKGRGDGRGGRERRRRDKFSSAPSKRDKGKLYVDDDQTESTGFTDAQGDGSEVGGGIKKKFENGVEEVHGTTQDILLSVFQICCAFALRGKEINDFVKEIDNARAELR
eukprot:CAMPEP_0178639688 /NCGR_PEP_ID=MMETSP0698-20121128/15597_1 /TAXON_ID=265572 /ORGANISM="Extubocellulus spinifer, Strain CCMP396" /LENGTH=428 /DNA_ID=CAMNT_0020280039 /DNA_START=243 /DNA_END=1529 /DNA_ORIENTATION=+